jgi:hypothetical protein
MYSLPSRGGCFLFTFDHREEETDLPAYPAVVHPRICAGLPAIYVWTEAAGGDTGSPSVTFRGKRH